MIQRTQWLPALLLFLRLVFGVSAQTPDDLVAAGRARLERHELGQAEVIFAEAVRLEPSHTAANALLGVVRLIRLVERPAISNILTASAVMTNGRSPYLWRAKLNHQTNGWPDFSAAADLASAESVIRSEVLPALAASRMNFQKAGVPGFSITLTEKETGRESVTIDHGDLLLVQAGLHGLELFLRSFYPYRVQEYLTDINRMVEEESLSAEGLLDKHPEAFAYQSPEDLSLARASLAAGIESYIEGYDALRTRPANTIRLFNLDTNEIASEARFRKTLLDVKKAMDGPVVLSLVTNLQLNLVPFFAGSTSPRKLAPQLSGNAVVAGSWPDSEFGGIVHGVDMNHLEASLVRRIWVASHLQVPAKLPDGSMLLSATAPGNRVMLLQGSADLNSWNDVEVRSSVLGKVIFLGNSEDTAYGFYRIIDAQEKATVTIRVVDRSARTSVAGARIRILVGTTVYIRTTDSAGWAVVATGLKRRFLSQATVTLIEAVGYPANQSAVLSLPKAFHNEVEFLVSP